MPYSGPDDDSLPDSVKELPTDKKKKWVAVFNDAHKSCMADEGEDCEGMAMKAANGAIKEDKEERSLIRRLIDFLTGVEQERKQEQAVERALSFNDLYGHVYHLLMQSDDPYAYLNDLYDDGSGNTFAVITSQGKLYRASVEVTDNTVSIGEMQEVVVEFVPRVRTRITRKNGQVRALVVAGSAVLNRVGEIDSRELFDSFIEHINRTGEFPEYGFFHLWDKERGFGDFRLGVVEAVGREGNLYIASILFDDTDLARAAVAAIEAEPDYWGNSIGFVASGSNCELLNVGEGITVPVYKRGRNREISLLPERDAAAWFTRIEVAQERAMNEREREALLKLYQGDEDKVEAFLANAQGVDRSIQEQGLITRQKQEGDASEGEKEPEGEEGASETLPIDGYIELDDEAIGEIVKQTLSSEPFTALADGFATLHAEVESLKSTLETERKRSLEYKTRLEALEQTDEQKRAQWQEDVPRKATRQATYRPREARRESAPSPEQEEEAIVGNALSKIPKY